MSHYGRFSALFLIPAIFVMVGCEGAPDDDDSGNHDPSQVLNSTQPLCQNSGSNPFWIANGTITVTCPSTCPDGSSIQCKAVLEQEVECVKGVVTPMGPIRQGEVIGPIGECSPR